MHSGIFFAIGMGFFSVLNGLAAEKPLLSISDLTLIDEPSVFRPLELNHGFSLGSLLVGDPHQYFQASTKELQAIPGFALLTELVEHDAVGAQAGDLQAGVGMSYNHRAFDPEFLNTELSRFALVGIVPRLDRGFARRGSCGEVRFIYRLAYKVKAADGQLVQSRLPMTINLVFYARDPSVEDSDDSINRDCKSIARAWLGPNGKPLDTDDPAAIVKYLVAPAGPLDYKRFTQKTLKSMEIDFQGERWPAAVKEDFGGYSQYQMRIVEWNPSTRKFTQGLLENQPDVARLNADSSLKHELLKYLREPETVEAIDQGTLVLPDRFLAYYGTSVTPDAKHRLQNRPFRQLFSPRDFDGISFAKAEYVKTPAALLRKLDQETCTGCHQTRSVAGFHFFGQNLDNNYVGNSVFIGVSPHLLTDIPRRRQLIKSLASNGTANYGRGFADRPKIDVPVPEGFGDSGLVSGWGGSCSLSKDVSYSNWACAPGLRCDSLVRGPIESEVGVCVSPKNQPQIGDACFRDSIQTGPKSSEDRLTRLSKSPDPGCGGGVLRCTREEGGFPGGSCQMADCGRIPEHGACGDLPTAHPGFNECLAEPGENFVHCIDTHAAPRGLRRCDAMNPCRDDYICTESMNQKTSGVCVPPYFLFQFRVDGHPVGRAG